jgi:hypothetical protein
MPDSIVGFIKENASLLGDNLRRLFRILGSPAAFIASTEHATQEQLLSASIFAILISLLNLVLNVPIFRLLDIEVESTSFLIADTVLTYVFLFLYGSGFHLAARVMQGKGSYTSSVVSFLYLTAFLPVIKVVSIPATAVVTRAIVEGPDTTTLAFQLATAEHLLRSPPAMIGALLMFVVYGWYFVALASVFRVVHCVGAVRGMCIALAGFVFWWSLSFWIEAPAVRMLWLAYRGSHA